MDYAQIHFGKPLGQITYQDVETFFSTEREETDQLEFKSFPATATLEGMITTLSEGISSFLNSSGGMLVWGAPEGRKPEGRKEKIFVGALTKVPLTVAKDWLISKVSDKIIPLPNGVRAQLIPTADSQVCIFEIDESPTSPHQTGGTYYMRLDGQKRPAPHHYVEALFKKTSYPQLEAYIKPYDLKVLHDIYSMKIDLYFFNYSQSQNEEDFNFKVNLSTGEFLNSHANGIRRQGYHQDGEDFTNDHDKFILFYGERMTHTLSLGFNKTKTADLNNKCTLILSYGGKKSPMKYCEYEIDFDYIEPGESYFESPVEMIRIVYQNRFISELHQEWGTTKEWTLRHLGVVQ